MIQATFLPTHPRLREGVSGRDKAVKCPKVSALSCRHFRAELQDLIFLFSFSFSAAETHREIFYILDADLRDQFTSTLQKKNKKTVNLFTSLSSNFPLGAFKFSLETVN